MEWNVDKIFNDHGGANDLHARLADTYPELTVRAVRQWKRRHNIPATWMARILRMNKVDVPVGWMRESQPELEDIF